MASTYTDSMALRQTIEVPDTRSAEHNHNFKRNPYLLSLETPSRSRPELNHDIMEEGEPPSRDDCGSDRVHDVTDSIITLSSSDKVAGQTVAPFLARHIPEQYAPQGIRIPPANDDKDLMKKNPNTKYCYRHRPDSKCRRTADEPTMEILQRDLETLTHADQQGISHVWSLFSAAPAKQRNLMLQGILAQCCFPQLSYLSATVRDLIRIDFVSALPSEISFKILCYLDTTSLCKAAQVSQKWRILADDDVVWHKMCEQHIDRKCTKCGWGLPLLERKQLREWKRQNQLRATGRGLNEWSPRLTPVPDNASDSALVKSTSLNGSSKRPCSAISSDGLLAATLPDEAKRQKSLPEHVGKPKFRPWKDVYKDRFKVGTNWKYGRCTMKLFRGHANGVMCLQYDDNILATGSYDSTIKIWDLESGECLRTLRGHRQGVRSLQFDDSKLISGSLDHDVRIWNWRTGECKTVLAGPLQHPRQTPAGIIAVHFEGKLLATGSQDRSVKIWNFETQETFCLRGHKDWVNAVRIDLASRTVFSASDDCTVRLWDLDTRRTIQVFEGHVGQVQQVTLLPPEYEPDDFTAEDDDGGSSNASGSEIDINSPRPTTTPFDSWPSCRPLPPRYMVTGGLDSCVRLWDVTTGRTLKTFFGHVEGVWAVAADSLRVISGSEDRMVKVWDARTGKSEKSFTGHSAPVTCIGLSDSTMATGSEDGDVRLYSFKNEGGSENLGDCDAPSSSARSS